MSVTLTAAYSGPYVGDGVNKNFGIGFEWEIQTEVTVWVMDEYGVEVQKTLGADFTINVGASRVEFVVAPASGALVTLIRVTSLTQSQKLVSQGRWNPETMGYIVDKLTRLVQEAKSLASKASPLPFGFYNLSPMSAGTVIADITATGLSDIKVSITNRQTSRFALVFEECVGGTAAPVSLQLSYDDGATWEAGTKYAYALRMRDTGGGDALSNSFAAANIPLPFTSLAGTGGGTGLCGTIFFQFPEFNYPYSMDVNLWARTSTGHFHVSGGASFYDAVFQWVDAIRILASGNFSGGRIRLIALP